MAISMHLIGSADLSTLSRKVIVPTTAPSGIRAVLFWGVCTIICFSKWGLKNTLIGGYLERGIKRQVGLQYLEVRSINVGETFATWRDVFVKKRSRTRRRMKLWTRRFEAKNRGVGEPKKWGYWGRFKAGRRNRGRIWCWKKKPSSKTNFLYEKQRQCKNLVFLLWWQYESLCPHWFDWGTQNILQVWKCSRSKSGEIDHYEVEWTCCTLVGYVTKRQSE